MKKAIIQLHKYRELSIKDMNFEIPALNKVFDKLNNLDDFYINVEVLNSKKELLYLIYFDIEDTSKETVHMRKRHPGGPYSIDGYPLLKYNLVLKESEIEDFDVSKLNNWILNALVETGRKGTWVEGIFRIATINGPKPIKCKILNESNGVFKIKIDKQVIWVSKHNIEII